MPSQNEEIEDNLETTNSVDALNNEAIVDKKSEENSVNTIPGTSSSSFGGLNLKSNSEKTVIKLFHDGKAGLEGLDAEKINAIINDTTRGSRFYNHKLEKQRKVQAQVEEMKQRLSQFTDLEFNYAKSEIDKVKAYFEPIGRDLTHIIVHIDMDMFFAAVEMRDDPSLQGKPMAVGSMSMLSTSNYEARKYGVRAAMPGFIAKKLCPQLIIISHGMGKYKAESAKVAEVIREYDAMFVPQCLDECSIDITACLLQKSMDENWPMEAKLTEAGDLVFDQLVWDKAAEIVNDLRNKVFERTQLTCSAGIAPNKMLAKICSDLRKPNNQYVLPGKSLLQLREFLREYNVKKIPGIGPVQQQTLAGLGIDTCEQLYDNLYKLFLLFTPNSIEFYVRTSMGIGSYSEETYEAAKSESRETTFKPTSDVTFLVETLSELSDCVSSSLKKDGVVGKTVTLKIKQDNFVTNVRSKTLSDYTNDAKVIFETGKQLFLKEIQKTKLVLRLIGIRISNFYDPSVKEVKKDDKVKRIDNFLVKKKEESHVQQEREEIQLAQAQVIQCVDAMLDQPSTSTADLKNTVTNETNVQEPKEVFICPICQYRKCYDLAELNSHVDYCLSRDAILSTIQEIEPPCIVVEPTESIVNKKDMKDKKVTKKRKIESPISSPVKTKKISDYFK